MGDGWKKKAQYLQNVANTVFAQCEIKLFDLQKIGEIGPGTTPQEFWKKFGVKIKTYLVLTKGFEHKTLGAIIGAGHSDYSGEGWMLFEELIPKGYQIKSDSVLVEFAAMSIVAAKINHFRNKRPYPHVNWD